MPSSRRLALAVVAGCCVFLASCSSSSSDSSSTSPTTATTATRVSPAWARIDQGLAALAPNVGFLVAKVASDGTCQPIHEVAASTARPTASQFKLFVLGALAQKVAAGQLSWGQTMTTRAATSSVGNSKESGGLQWAPAGTKVPVEQVATKMISISDNTAADMLIGLVGRDAVEAQMRDWSTHASVNHPFLTTREAFLLKYADWPALANRYLATPSDGRAAVLRSSVDPLALSALAAGYTTAPRAVDPIEWFAAPDDVCRAFAGLHGLSAQAALEPLSTILSRQLVGIGLDRSEWPTVWYKGGSESGVLTLGFLATNASGQTYVVEAMVSNPKAALSETSITDLVALCRQSFGLVAR
jgi:hypothetical protein